MDDPREDQQPEADEGTQEFVEEVESDPTAPPADDENLERVRGG